MIVIPNPFGKTLAMARAVYEARGRGEQVVLVCAELSREQFERRLEAAIQDLKESQVDHCQTPSGEEVCRPAKRCGPDRR